MLRDTITKNPRLGNVYPGLKEDKSVREWRKNSLIVERNIEVTDPSIEAHGILTTGVGGRADIIIFDD